MDQAVDFLAGNRWVLAAAGFMTLIGLFAWIKGLLKPAERSASRGDIDNVARIASEARELAQKTLDAQLARAPDNSDLLKSLSETQRRLAAMTESYERLLLERAKPGQAESVDSALTLAKKGDVTQAVAILTRLAKADEAAGNRPGAAKTYREIGALLISDNNAGARDAYEKALALEPNDMYALTYAAYLRRRAGDYFGAQTAAEKLKGLASAAAHQVFQVEAMDVLIDVHQARRQYKEAESVARETLAIAEQMGDVPRQIRALNQAGTAQARHGQSDQARKSLMRAKTLAEQSGDKKRVSISLSNLGLLALTTGDQAAAESLYRQSIAIAEEMNDTKRIAGDYGNLGITLMNRGQFDEALALFEKSMALGQQTGSAEVMANQKLNIARAHRFQGKHDIACAEMREALAMYTKIGHGGAKSAQEFLTEWKCGA